jgi:hypothetical protein
MTARERIQKITHTWYGYTVFAAVASVVQVALWPFSPGLLFSPVKLAFTIVGAALGVVVSVVLNLACAAIGIGVASLLGRALLARSSFVRLVLLVVSTLGFVFGGYSALKLTWAAIAHFSPSTLVGAVVTGIGVLLYIRSYQVLTDPSVKSYIAS